MSRHLPPLNALRAFEAAARHQSVSKAAEELNVTPAAVSHQVKALEEYFGVALFRRAVRTLYLTPEGSALLPNLSGGFDALAEACEELENEKRRGILTVASTPSFAAKWLVQHLDSFSEQHPDITVRIEASLEPVTFQGDGVDVAIRFGPGDYPGLHTDSLMMESVLPVCAPELIDGPQPLRSPADLAHHTLIHLDWHVAGALQPDWRMWLTMAGVDGVDPSKGPVYDTDSLALQAAIDGKGVALVSDVMAAHDLAKGRVVAPFDLILPSECGYWFLCPPDSLERPKVAAFRAWILDAVRDEAAQAAEAAARSRDLRRPA